MTDTLVSLSSAAAPVRCRYLAGNAHAQPTATVSAAFHRQKRRSLGATSPFRPQPGRPTAPSQCSLARRPNPEIQKTNQTRALNPHSPTAPPTQTPPAVSALEAFRTPASVHARAPVTGRRPKTLNDSGPSRPQPGTGRFDPKVSSNHADKLAAGRHPRVPVVGYRSTV